MYGKKRSSTLKGGASININKIMTIVTPHLECEAYQSDVTQRVRLHARKILTSGNCSRYKTSLQAESAWVDLAVCRHHLQEFAFIMEHCCISKPVILMRLD